MKEVQRKYQDVLHGKYKELGYFAERLNLASSTFEFFRIICESIALLLRQGKGFETVYSEWITQGNDSDNKYNQMIYKSYEEVKNSYKSLITALDQENFLDKKCFKQTLDYLNHFSTNKEVTRSATVIRTNVHYFEQLCYQLLYLNRKDLIANYARLQIVRQYRVHEQTGALILDPESGQAIIDEKKEISEFIFAPSFYELIKLKEAYSLERCSKAWVALRYILHAEECWKTPYTFFEDKKSDIVQKPSETIGLWSFHCDWIAMNYIKNRQNNKIVESSLFTRERYIRFFDLIFSQIVVDQATNEIQENLYAMELEWDKNKFLLKIEWFKGDKIERYLIKKVQDKKSEAYQILEAIFAANDGTAIDLTRLDLYSSYASRSLEKIKITGVLAEIFFKKTSSTTLTIRSRRIVVSEISGMNLNDLKSQLETLKKVN